MYTKYDELNEEAKAFFLILLTKKIKKKDKFNRCKQEIDLLYDKGFLFIIEYLYKYKEQEKNISFHFKGMANNLLLLYILGLSKIDPIKYNLPYELFNDKTLSIDFINDSSLNFIDFIERTTGDFRIVKGSFDKTEIEEINMQVDNHYLFIPCYMQPNNMTFRLNEFNQFETIEDYHIFTDEYIAIRLDDKIIIQDDKVDINNSLHTKFEKELVNILEPKTVEDYAKIISLSHSTHVWKNNQDILFESKEIDIKSLISNREDIYEYLIIHSIDNETAIDIIKAICKKRTDTSNEMWRNYIQIMKKHNCEKRFIDTISKILYISGRGQAISECLYAIDEKNYYQID